jgi:hypothetical protein
MYVVRDNSIAGATGHELWRCRFVGSGSAAGMNPPPDLHLSEKAKITFYESDRGPLNDLCG